MIKSYPYLTVQQNQHLSVLQARAVAEDLHGQRDYDRLELENNKPQFNKAVYLKEI
jgi:hypothetical protein